MDKTYFYILTLQKDATGEFGSGGFETQEAARLDACRFLVAGSVYTGAAIYSIDGATKKVKPELHAKPEYRVIWVSSNVDPR